MSKNVRPNRRPEPKLRRMDRQGWKSLGGAVLKVVLTCVVACGIPYGVFMYYRHLSETGYFSPHHISVQGNIRTDDASILDASGIRQEDVNLAELDVHTVESSIETLPWVKQAHVTISLPDTIQIKVEEHEPLGLVNDGALTIVDGSGALIKYWDAKDVFTSPIVTLDKPMAERTEEILQAFELASMARRQGYDKRIHEIHYDAATGYSLYTADTEIRMGYDRFEARFDRLMQVESVLKSHRVVPEYVLLDADGAIDRVAVKPKLGDTKRENRENTQPPEKAQQNAQKTDDVIPNQQNTDTSLQDTQKPDEILQNKQKPEKATKESAPNPSVPTPEKRILPGREEKPEEIDAALPPMILTDEDETD